MVDFADAVADAGGGGEGEVDDAEGDVFAFGDVAADEFAGASDAVGGVFDLFGDFVEGGAGVGAQELFNGAFDDAGAADADVDDALGFTGAEHGTGHEGVVFGHVGEDDNLGAAEAADMAAVGGGLDDLFGDKAHGIDVDAGAGGADVDGGADAAGLGEGLGEGFDEDAFAGGDAFLDEGGEAAEEVDVAGGCGVVEDFAEADGGFDSVAFEEDAGRGDGDAFVDDGDAVACGDLIADGDVFASLGEDALVDGFEHGFGVAVGTAVEVDAEGDGTDVEVFFLHHADGGEDVVSGEHRFKGGGG